MVDDWKNPRYNTCAWRKKGTVPALVFRATLTAAVAPAAAYVVQIKTLPALDRESLDTLQNLPTALHGLVALRDRQGTLSS